MIWEKKGKIFAPAGEYGWMNSHAQVPYAFELTDRVRIYFATREKYDKNGQCRAFGGYIDVDKNDFSKILEIGSDPAITPGGVGEFDEFGAMPVSVIEKDGLYFMYYTGWTRAVSTPHKEAIGIAVSRDGKAFKKIARGPLMGEVLYEPFVSNGPYVYRFNGMYHMFYAAGIQWLKGEDRMEIQYVIRHAVSNDAVNWHRDYVNIIPQAEEYECQNSPAVFYSDGRYNMIFCYRCGLDFRNARGRGYRLGYAVSEDLRNWTRKDEEVGIYLSDSGWDSEMMCYPSIREIGWEIYMFYSGNGFGQTGFGYAKLVDANMGG